MPARIAPRRASLATALAAALCALAVPAPAASLPGAATPASLRLGRGRRWTQDAKTDDPGYRGSARASRSKAMTPSAARRRPRPTRRCSTCRSRSPSSPSRLIRDQAMQGMADVVRYVPGVGMAQGEGNRDTPSSAATAPPPTSSSTACATTCSTSATSTTSTGRGAEGSERDDLRPRRLRRRAQPRQQAGGLGQRSASSACSSAPGTSCALTGDVGQAINDSAAFRVNGAVRELRQLSRRRLGRALRHQSDCRLRMRRQHRSSRSATSTSRTSARPTAASRRSTGARSTSTARRSSAIRSAAEATVDVDAFMPCSSTTSTTASTLRNRTRYADYDKFYQNVFPGACIADDDASRSRRTTTPPSATICSTRPT